MISFKTLIRRFNREQRASAMTEFVMGLPVYILIFSGMGALYRLNQDKLESYASSAATMWVGADPGAGQILPIAAFTNISSINGAVQNGASAFGIYADSGLKAQAGRLAGSLNPVFTASDALGIAPSGDSFSRTLLDDNIVTGIGNASGGSGWANILSSVLTISGTRPALAAGLRYGAHEGTSVTRSGTIWGTNYNYDPGFIDVPGITQPTHRSLAVVMTRLEFGTESVYDDQILEFNEDFNFGTTNAANGVNGADCTNAGSALQACNAQPATGTPPVPPDCSTQQSDFDTACQGLGTGGSPFGSFGWGNAGMTPP